MSQGIRGAIIRAAEILLNRRGKLPTDSGKHRLNLRLLCAAVVCYGGRQIS